MPLSANWANYCEDYLMATILKQVDIRTVPSNLNREKVMQEIVDVSLIPLPFQSMVGKESHDNQFFEWAADRLATPSLTNRFTDGDTAGTPATRPAVRLGNNSQISTKVVSASMRTESANTVGNEGLARQISMRTKELQRDMDAMLLQNISNKADTGVAGTGFGITAGLEAWLDDQTIQETPVTKSPQTVLVATGITGTLTIGSGWTARGGTTIIPVNDYASLTATAALSFAQLKQVLNGLYQLGCDPTKIMAEPDLISRLSSFMFTSTAQIATLVRDANESSEGATAQSSVNSMISDFGIVVDFVPNRLQQPSGDGSPVSSTLFVFDPSYLAVSYQGGGIKSQELARTGLSKPVQIYADYGLMVKNPDALGGIIGLNKTLAVVA
jgi:hypothetical protein